MSVGEIVSRCRDFVASNNFVAAEAAIAELSALEGCRAEAGFLKGMLSYRQGDFTAAREALDDSLAFNGSSVEALELKLRVVSLQGDAGGAADLATQIVAQEPSSIGVLNMCAKALVKAGKLEGAVGVWSRIAEMAPGDAAPLIAIASAYLKSRSYKQAFDAAIAAFEREPSERAILLATDSALKTKNLSDLAFAANKLADLDAQAALAYVRPLLTPEHAVPAAKILIRAGVSLESKDAETAVNILVKQARNSEKAGDEVTAAEAWGLVLQLEPDHSKASSSLRRYLSGLMKSGVASLESGQTAEAIPVLQKIVETDPAMGTAWRKLAVAFNREGNHADEAEAWRRLAHLTGDADAWQRALRAARKCDPSEAQLLLFVDARAHMEADTGLKEKGDSLARKLGKSAFQRVGDEPFAATLATMQAIRSWDAESPALEKLRARLGAALLRVLRNVEASDETRTEAAEKLAAVDPVNGAALQWLSKVYFKSRKFDAASEVFVKLIQLDPEEKSYWHYLGRCRKALKKPELNVEFANLQAQLHPNGAAGAYLEEVAAA